jgi:tRNA G18 (ribose-2'-O)-methylase SpoU
MSVRVPAKYKNFQRDKTRIEITKDKADSAVKLPVSLACVHLFSDGNLGFLIRAAACFGASEVLVIGTLPPYRELRQLSCGLNNFIDIKTFSNPSEFLQYTRDNDIHVVSLELTRDSIDLTEYKFPTDKRVCIITGNESVGVPSEIIHNSDCVVIPNPGIAPCMNTSQAANVALYEYMRQVYKGI